MSPPLGSLGAYARYGESATVSADVQPDKVAVAWQMSGRDIIVGDCESPVGSWGVMRYE